MSQTRIGRSLKPFRHPLLWSGLWCIAVATIVVFSLLIVILRARPRSESWTPSSSMPRSLKIALPPVRTAMSSSMALRRSP